MLHIRQKNIEEGENLTTYTVINTEEWDGSLETHPSILEHPDLFEIVDEEIPTFYQILNYE